LTSTKNLKYYKPLIIVLFGMVIAYAYYSIQPPNNFRNSELSDAKEYEKIYTYFNEDTDFYHVRFGIHNRIAIPYLASLLPNESPESSFFIVNTFLAILSLLAIFYLMKSYKIKMPFIMLCLCFFSFHWVGPFRQNAISPLNVDMGVYLFEVIFLLLFVKRKYLGLLIIAPFAIAIKEIFLAYLVVFLLVSVLWKYRFKDKNVSISWVFSILFVGVSSKILLNHFFPSISPANNSVIVLAFHFKEMILHPDHLLRWFLSLFAAYGAFLFLIIKRRLNIRSLSKEVFMIHILALSAFAMSAFGGMDYTRLIFLGFPYVMVSILLVSNPGKGEFLIAFILSLLLTRFWKVLPDPSSDLSVYNLWMPEYADAKHLWIWLIIAVFCLLLTIIFRKLILFKNDSDQVS